MDRMTIIPARRKRTWEDLSGVVLPPADVDACLSCISIVPGGGDDAASLAINNPNPDTFTGDLLIALQGNPDAESVHVTGGDPATLYVQTLVVEMLLYLAERRTVVIQLVDPGVARLPGWAKGYVWRRQALRHRGLSPYGVIEMAEDLQKVVRTWDPPV